MREATLDAKIAPSVLLLVRYGSARALANDVRHFVRCIYKLLASQERWRAQSDGKT
jgi:hypothetical protein